MKQGDLRALAGGLDDLSVRLDALADVLDGKAPRASFRCLPDGSPASLLRRWAKRQRLWGDILRADGYARSDPRR